MEGVALEAARLLTPWTKPLSLPGASRHLCLYARQPIGGSRLSPGKRF